MNFKTRKIIFLFKEIPQKTKLAMLLPSTYQCVSACLHVYFWCADIKTLYTITFYPTCSPRNSLTLKFELFAFTTTGERRRNEFGQLKYKLRKINIKKTNTFEPLALMETCYFKEFDAFYSVVSDTVFSGSKRNILNKKTDY